MHENFVGNIIVNLANLPDFLRKPILKKRMAEFFSMSEPEKVEVIYNALEAGPTIPFPNFSKLLKTWLEILTIFSKEQRNDLVAHYIHAIVESPQKIISFNLDGILEIFLSLEEQQKQILAESIRDIVEKLDSKNRKRFFLLTPDNAKMQIGL